MRGINDRYNALEKNDDEWKAERDAEWPIFEGWLVERYSFGEDRWLKESLDSSKIFYDTGVIDFSAGLGFKNIGFYEALALHPCLDEISVREIMNLDCYGEKSLKGSFYQRYLLKTRYNSLIEKGVLPGDFILTLLKGFYGRDLAEASEILEFDLQSQAFHIVYNLGSKLFLFAADGEDEYIDHEIASHMLPFFLAALPLLSEEDAEKCNSRFKAFVKVKVREFDSGAITDPQGREFMEKILQGIKSCWGNLNHLV